MSWERWVWIVKKDPRGKVEANFLCLFQLADIKCYHESVFISQISPILGGKVSRCFTWFWSLSSVFRAGGLSFKPVLVCLSHLVLRFSCPSSTDCQLSGNEWKSPYCLEVPPPVDSGNFTRSLRFKQTQTCSNLQNSPEPTIITPPLPCTANKSSLQGGLMGQPLTVPGFKGHVLNKDFLWRHGMAVEIAKGCNVSKEASR